VAQYDSAEIEMGLLWGDFGDGKQSKAHTDTHTHTPTHTRRDTHATEKRILFAYHYCVRVHSCLFDYLCVCAPVWLSAFPIVQVNAYVCMFMCVCVSGTKCGQTFPGHQIETLDKSV